MCFEYIQLIKIDLPLHIWGDHLRTDFGVIAPFSAQGMLLTCDSENHRFYFNASDLLYFFQKLCLKFKVINNQKLPTLNYLMFFK